MCIRDSLLADRGTGGVAESAHEGVRHSAAYDESVNLVDEVFDNADRVGNLCSAEDSGCLLYTSRKKGFAPKNVRKNF